MDFANSPFLGKPTRCKQQGISPVKEYIRLLGKHFLEPCSSPSGAVAESTGFATAQNFRKNFLFLAKTIKIRCVPVQEVFVAKAAAPGAAKCAGLFPKNGDKGDEVGLPTLFRRLPDKLLIWGKNPWKASYLLALL